MPSVKHRLKSAAGVVLSLRGSMAAEGLPHALCSAATAALCMWAAPGTSSRWRACWIRLAAELVPTAWVTYEPGDRGGACSRTQAAAALQSAVGVCPAPARCRC
jgi:hypothetical protein